MLPKTGAALNTEKHHGHFPRHPHFLIYLFFDFQITFRCKGSYQQGFQVVIMDIGVLPIWSSFLKVHLPVCIIRRATSSVLFILFSPMLYYRSFISMDNNQTANWKKSLLLLFVGLDSLQHSRLDVFLQTLQKHFNCLLRINLIGSFFH